MLNVDTQVNEALDVYCQWLNQWTTATDTEPHQYNREQFLITDPDKKLWGDTQVLLSALIGEGKRVVMMAVSDGDDGGPATLTCFYHWDDSTERWSLFYMVQEFDTMWQEIYNTTILDVRAGRTSPFLHTP